MLASLAMPTPEGASFKAYRQFNDPRLASVASLRGRLDDNLARFFPADTVLDRFAVELSSRRALPFRELLESAELFERVRRRVRRPVVADLCSGHGLVGLLFGMLEPETEQVILVDRRRPKSFTAVLEAAELFRPGLSRRVRYVESRLRADLPELRDVHAIVAVHACGSRTDRCLEAAIARRVPVAVMPCCYRGTADRAPVALRAELDAGLTTDVDRTYRLEAAGFRVAWGSIPSVITRHHRVIVAEPRPQDRAGATASGLQ